MRDESAGLPADVESLLDEHLQSFEHLEALLLLHREPRRDWTADEVADALGTRGDLTAVLESLLDARLIAARRDEPAPFSYGPVTHELAAAVESLAGAYENHRAVIIRRMNSNVIARLRSDAARAFADSFVVPARARVAGAWDDVARRPIGLFLDVDGTLLDFAGRPDEVIVPDRAVAVLARLHAVLCGALALISGRKVQQLDTLFAPLKLPCAGVHGGERRDCSGQMHCLVQSAEARLDLVRGWLGRFVAAHPGLLLEDKGASIALHFRGRPTLAAIVEDRLVQARAQLGHGFRIQEGVLVRELVPTAAHKGDAVEAFLAEPPFTGRVPVFIGDDATDLDGFAAVERHGGRSIAVGPRVAAATRLPQPSAVIDWLEFLVRAEGRCVGTNG